MIQTAASHGNVHNCFQSSVLGTPQLQRLRLARARERMTACHVDAGLSLGNDISGWIAHLVSVSPYSWAASTRSLSDRFAMREITGCAQLPGKLAQVLSGETMARPPLESEDEVRLLEVFGVSSEAHSG